MQPNVGIGAYLILIPSEALEIEDLKAAMELTSARGASAVAPALALQPPVCWAHVCAAPCLACPGSTRQVAGLRSS